MSKYSKGASTPAYALEKEVVRDEIERGLQLGVETLEGKATRKEKTDNIHNTKYLLKQYRRVVYSVRLSEADMNARMEMEHGLRLSSLEVNAELAGIDLSDSKLEAYANSVIRSKNMLQIIDNALEGLRMDPDRGEYLYQLLYVTYFSPQKPKNRDAILSELDRLGYPMSIPTYHNHLKVAIKAIDRILWGYTARDCIELIKQFLPE